MREGFSLDVRTVAMGRDYVILLSGGEAHVGAVAVAYWHEGQVQCHLLEVPSHKEGELARELAQLACERLGATVTLAAGIHIDQATKTEIQEIVEQARLIAGQEVNRLVQQKNSQENSHGSIT